MTETKASPLDTTATPNHSSARAHRHQGNATHHAGHHRADHSNHAFGSLVSGATHRHAARVALPSEVANALQTAMSKEGVPSSWQQPLQFIIGQESNGKVDATNHSDTARGLFQLTRASYHLNPNGAHSFGNPVEEAQGGIRYIQQRYQTADNAMDFWQKHGWY